MVYLMLDRKHMLWSKANIGGARHLSWPCFLIDSDLCVFFHYDHKSLFYLHVPLRRIAKYRFSVHHMLVIKNKHHLNCFLLSKSLNNFTAHHWKKFGGNFPKSLQIVFTISCSIARDFLPWSFTVFYNQLRWKNYNFHIFMIMSSLFFSWHTVKLQYVSWPG